MYKTTGRYLGILKDVYGLVGLLENTRKSVDVLTFAALVSIDSDEIPHHICVLSEQILTLLYLAYGQPEGSPPNLLGLLFRFKFSVDFGFVRKTTASGFTERQHSQSNGWGSIGIDPPSTIAE